MNFLGCLFILIFGFVFIIIGFANSILRMFGINLFSLYKVGKKHNQQRSQQTNYHQPFEQNSTSTAGTHSGNAHHEGGNPNSRQRRSNKIFEKNEGEYVDFEEV